MRYCSLGSGSRGNATLVADGDQALLIDCGFSRKNVLQRVLESECPVEQLQGVLVTHEHSDHAKGVQSLCEALDIPFYCSHGTARKMQWQSHELWRCITAEEAITVAGIQVMPVVVPHDALEPLQFVLRSRADRVLGVLSDLGSLTPHVLSHYRQCHGLQVEANHDPFMLQNGPYPPSLRARVAGQYGHLSNQQCAELIRASLWSGLQSVSAGHISEKNNDEQLVRQMLAQVLSCQPEEVQLLSQDEVSPWQQLN
ncbi:MBL fold metallo-hydrolase [Bacterioplanes sanyensis]|uniref:MBL fold metallo-hydrolase n=1 Tax=Bacterioplanes sanyensis TaxID=1249553 RepID=UPI0012FDC5C9|nr:MBL fold metallo-hydrolase [Bacterioplanes sanyensis]